MRKMFAALAVVFMAGACEITDPGPQMTEHNPVSVESDAGVAPGGGDTPVSAMSMPPELLPKSPYHSDPNGIYANDTLTVFLDSLLSREFSVNWYYGDQYSLDSIQVPHAQSPRDSVMQYGYYLKNEYKAAEIPGSLVVVQLSAARFRVEGIPALWCAQFHDNKTCKDVMSPVDGGTSFSVLSGTVGRDMLSGARLPDDTEWNGETLYGRRWEQVRRAGGAHQRDARTKRGGSRGMESARLRRLDTPPSPQD